MIRIDGKTALLIVSASVNLLLSWRVYSDTGYEERLSDARRPPHLKIGALVPSISGNDPAGAAMEVGYGRRQRPVILYAFAAKCGWCKRNLPAVKQLRAETRDRYEFYALALSDADLSAYIHDNDFDIPVVANLSDETRQAYALRSTPETILVSADGRVVNVWSGAYRGAVKAEIEQTLGVRLPELAPVD